MDFSLEGKTALVTGASRGIGQATALALAQTGADVVVVSRTVQDLEKVADRIRGLGRKSRVIATDVASTKQINSLVSKMRKEFGRIDILVNNAGISLRGMDSALEIGEADWDRIMNVNLKGLFFLSQAVARLMKEQGGGCIINVASSLGVRPAILRPTYSISKAAVIAATKAMAGEWAKYGIRVNAVAPGLVKTGFSEAVWKNPQVLEDFLKKVPLRCFAEPEEIAAMIVYLASDDARFVTGGIINIDGGMTI